MCFCEKAFLHKSIFKRSPKTPPFEKGRGKDLYKNIYKNPSPPSLFQREEFWGLDKYGFMQQRLARRTE